MGRPASDPVDAIASGYRDAQILLTANRLGVFETLGGETLGPDPLAARLSCSPRGTRILCDALVALGLLEKTSGGYRNGTLAREYLLPDAPRSKRAVLRHAARLYERWAGLLDAVRTGQPVPDERLDSRLSSTPQEFAHAMADVGRAAAGGTCAALDLRGVERVLDIGGGPGVYAIELARREPGLEVVILDAAETLEAAGPNVEAAGLGERITLRAGDALVDDLGGPYDVVLLSNFIHIFPAESVRALVVKCAAALAAGGRLAIKDLLLDDSRTSPTGAAVFAVNMLVSTEAGDCHTESDLRTWLQAAGLVVESVADVASVSRLVIARRPG